MGVKGKKLKVSYVQKKSLAAISTGGWLNGMVTGSKAIAMKDARRIAQNRYNANTAVRVVRYPVILVDGKKVHEFIVQFKRVLSKWT